MSQELAAITNEGVVNGFRNADQQAGYWLQDDPSLSALLSWIRSYY